MGTFLSVMAALVSVLVFWGFGVPLVIDLMNSKIALANLAAVPLLVVLTTVTFVMVRWALVGRPSTEE